MLNLKTKTVSLNEEAIKGSESICSASAVSLFTSSLVLPPSGEEFRQTVSVLKTAAKGIRTIN